MGKIYKWNCKCKIKSDIHMGLIIIATKTQAQSHSLMQDSYDSSQSATKNIRDEAAQAYERREMPDVLPVLRSLARQTKVFRRFPVLKVLKDIARLFLLSHTQALFFMYLVKTTRWGVGEAWIRVYSGRVRDLFCFVHEEQEYLQMLLYLLLASYSVKQCLNRREPMLLQRAIKICPDFLPAFKEWSLRHAKSIKDIHPKLLNRLYMDLWEEERHDQFKILPNYMTTVDEILEICLPYSETRVEVNYERRQALKRYAQTELWHQKSQKRRKMDKGCGGQLCATFIEVVEMGSTGDQCEEHIEEHYNELGIVICNRREAMCQADTVAHSEEDYCESLNLCKQESEEHIIFMKKELEHERYSLRFFCDDSEPHML